MSASSRQVFTEVHQRLQQIYPAEEARTIAFLLLEHCFGLNRTAVLADKAIPGDPATQLNPLLERLLTHEPLQYVLGRTLFYGRWFGVNTNVLIPRPETEELVHWIIEEHRNTRELVITDIGTGSGCIAVTLAAELPGSHVWAIDVSEKALEVARNNADYSKTAIHFVQADILDTASKVLPDEVQLDILVSNPPYVTRAEMSMMRKNVTEYEPHLALFVEGTDALLFYRRIAQIGVTLLKKGGACYVETNESFTSQVQSLFEQSGYRSAVSKTDMSGKFRFVKAVL